MNGPERDDTDRIMDAYKPTRRRKGRAGQPNSLLQTSSATAAAAAAAVPGATGKNKNAVMLLNELQPGGLRYDGVTKSGPDHKPVYTASVTIYGQVSVQFLQIPCFGWCN